MRSEIAQPCSGPVTSVRKIKRSSEPCGKSTFITVIAHSPPTSTGVCPLPCRSARGILSKVEGNADFPAVPHRSAMRVLVPAPAYSEFSSLVIDGVSGQMSNFSARADFRGFLVLIRRNSQPLPYYLQDVEDTYEQQHLRQN